MINQSVSHLTVLLVVQVSSDIYTDILIFVINCY